MKSISFNRVFGHDTQERDRLFPHPMHQKTFCNLSDPACNPLPHKRLLAIQLLMRWMALLLLLVAWVAPAANTPVITPIPDQATVEDVMTPWVPFLAYDLETGVGLTGFSGSSSNPELVPDSNIFLWGLRSNWLVRLAPALHQYGTATITVTATNAEGIAATATFQLTVTSVNQSPTLSAIPEQFLHTNDGVKNIALTGITSGAQNEEQALAVTATESVPGIITNLQVAYTSPLTTGTLSFETVSDAAGSVVVTVSVDDGGASNNITTRSFTVHVNAGNYPPVISSIPEVQVQEDSITDNVIFTVSDIESTPQSLVVTAHSSSPALIPDENITIIRAGRSGLIKLVPVADAFGSASITVTVADADGGSSSTTFPYTVLPVNDPPTLDAIVDLTPAENAGLLVVSLSGITPGPENEAQTAAVFAYATPPGILTNVQVNYLAPSTVGTLSFGTVSNASGEATVTVIVDDGTGSWNITSRSFVVEVIALNESPNVSSIPDQVTDLGIARQINFQVGDSDDAADSLIVSATSSNPMLVPEASIVFEGSGSNRVATVTPMAGQYGTAIITITVVDTADGQGESSFVLTVRPDPLAPYITQQPRGQKVGEQGTASFIVVANGEPPLTYQWQRNGNDLANQTGATLNLANVELADAGDYTVVVSNGQGASTSLVARLEVLVAPTMTQLERAASTMRLSFTTVAGQQYAIEFKNSLLDINWTLFERKAGTGEIVTVEDMGAKLPARFYRVRVE